MIRANWLIYTVLIGLIPFIIRFFLFVVVNGTKANYILNEIDMVMFGLVLHLSNINELDNYAGADKKWRSVSVGFSRFFIILFAVLLGFSYVCDLGKMQDINRDALKWMSFLLSSISFVFSFSIFTKLNRS